MSAYVEMGGTRSKLGNITFITTGPDSAILMSNSGTSVTDVIVFNDSINGHIVVQGNDCHITRVRGAGASLAVIEVTGDRAIISDVTSENGTTGCAVRLNTSQGSIVSGVTSTSDEKGIIILNSTYCTVTDFYILTSDAESVRLDGSDYCTVKGTILSAGQHGVVIDDSDHNKVECTVVNSGRDTNNTYDNIRVEGASNRNMIQNCKLQGTVSGNDTRYGVNVAGTGECNIVVGNDFGDPADYGTNAYVSTASNTQIFYPADATYGDNWTDCGSGS